jgi:transposase-like protein
MKRRNAQTENINREKVIAEYLHGNESFAELGKRYNLPWRTIQSWVRSHRLKHGQAPASGATEREKQLQAELEARQLKIELLEEMLSLSEKHTGISLRKKFGTKRS